MCAQQAHKTTCHSNAFCMTDSGCSRRVGKRDDGGMRGSLVSDGLLHDAWPHDASCCHVYICKPCSWEIIMRIAHGHAMHRGITCIYACCSRGIIMRTADGHAIHRGTTCKTACHGLGGSSCIQRMGMQCLVLSHAKQHAMAWMSLP